MKLAQARQGQVVRNADNGSYYRFERSENSGTRVRIRPLELFPNGLLIAKPTDTVVEATITVDVVGMWSDGMSVQGAPTRSRRAYENELVREELRLIVLERQYEELPQGGKGKLSRGSHANKVKNCAMRIGVLKRGLGFNENEPVLSEPPQESQAAFAFQANDLVQLPSGLPAAILGFQADDYVRVRTRCVAGIVLEAPLPMAVLRPWELARVGTV